jgi:RNA polymerase-binding transcription factor DksA
MKARFEMSRSTLRATTGRLSALQTDTARALLLVRLEQQTAEFTQRAAILADLGAHSPADPTGRDRAMAAIQAYRSRETIENIEAALGRIDDGVYGTCQSCDRPIPIEHLAAMPQSPLCASCSRRAPQGHLPAREVGARAERS